MATVEMQTASAPGASQQAWHGVQEMPQEQVPAARWELEKKARQRTPQQSLGRKAEDQTQELQEGAVTQRRQKDQDRQDEESTNWGKVEQSAQDAANPQGKSKKVNRTSCRLGGSYDVWGGPNP